MCLLCVEIQKGKMRSEDIIKNFTELANTDAKHAEEVAEKYGDLIVKPVFENDDFGELDELGWTMPPFFLDDHFDD